MHFLDLMVLELSPTDTVKGILNGEIQVEEYTDNLILAEDYLMEIEDLYMGEDTKPAWDVITNTPVL